MSHRISIKNIGRVRMMETLLRNAIENVIIMSYMSENSTRSSTRTDKLHYDLKNIFICSDDIKIFDKKKIEVRIDSDKKNTKIFDSRGGKISCDLLGLVNNEKKFAIFAKAPISSINKNFHTYNNNLFGEAHRVLGHVDNEFLKILFINIMPNKTFIFDNKGNVKGLETVKHKIELLEENKSALYKALENKYKEITVTYDINEDILKANNKKEIGEKIQDLTSNNNNIISNVKATSLYEAFIDLYENV